MQRITTPAGVTVSFESYGSGPPLVLVHGSFSDHITNWELVKPLLEPRFHVYAVARRGRGETDATEGHSVDDEIDDVVAVVLAVGEPVFLLGHSHGARVALGAAGGVPDRVRKLVLYEPPGMGTITPGLVARLETLAAAGDRDRLIFTFFHEGLLVPLPELEELRATPAWPPILADAPASMGDLRAIARHSLDPARYRRLDLPVLLQIGTESPRHLFATDALAAVLPDARIGALAGQAHEGMTTAPELYAEQVTTFLLS